MEEHRVKFYSATDLANGSQLSAAEKILKKFDAQKDILEYSINNVIELYNIGLFIDKEIFLKTWTDEDKHLFRTTAKKFPAIIGHFFSTVSNDNFIQIYFDVDSEYKEDFFHLLKKRDILNFVTL